MEQKMTPVDNDKELHDKSVDIIIPVYHCKDELAELVKRLQMQDQKVNRIVLMHTQDGTDLSWLSGKYDNVLVKDVRPEEFDHGGTRDEGIRASEAEIVICMTQDALPASRHLIRNLVDALANDRAAAAYARQLPAPDCNIIERYTRQFNYPKISRRKSKADIEELGIKTYFCSNVCAAYKRDIYLNLGGFEHKTIFNEDMIFTSKIINAGYEIAYEAKAEVIHSHNYSCAQQFKRNFDLAVSQRQHPEIFQGIQSETEGIRLVKQTAAYLLRIRHPLMILYLIMSSAAKYAGYTLGKQYKRLPGKIIQICTMNPKYWG